MTDSSNAHPDSDPKSLELFANLAHSRQLFEMPTIVSRLPFPFPKTDYVIQDFTGKCGQCGQVVDPALLRGRLDLSFPTVAQLDAVGACPHCRIFTRFEYRMHDDGAITGFRDGKWQRWEPHRGTSTAKSAKNQPNNRAPKRAGHSGFSDPSPTTLSGIVQLLVVAVVWPFYLTYRYGSWAIKKFFR